MNLRTLFAILLVALALNISTPREAQAQAANFMCAGTESFPMLNLDCLANATSAIASAVANAVNVVMQSFITRVQIMFGRGIARAQMQHTAWLANREASARHLTTNSAGSLRASCQATTAGAVAMTGNAVAAGSEQPRPVVRVGRDRTGRFPSLQGLEARGARPGSVAQIASDQAAQTIMETRQLATTGSQAGAIADFEATRRWRPIEELPEPERAAAAAARATTGERPFADISAQSLIGPDTYDEGTPEINKTRADEALAYCVNLMVPGTPDRPGGASDTEAVIADAVQRAGDARIALSVKACTDAVGRRLPIPFNRENQAYSWVVSAACSYRQAFDNLNEGAMKGTMRTCDDSDANPDVNMSQLELMRVVSSDIFGTSRAATAQSNAGPAELQRVLIAMEAVNSQILFETMRLQEQLGLIQAASLAADVKRR